MVIAFARGFKYKFSAHVVNDKTVRLYSRPFLSFTKLMFICYLLSQIGTVTVSVSVCVLGFKKRNARRERLLLRALGESSDLQVEPVEARLPPCLLARGLEPACFGLLRITIAPPPPLLLLTNTEYNT